MIVKIMFKKNNYLEKTQYEKNVLENVYRKK